METHRPLKDQLAVLKVLEEYIQLGAVQEVQRAGSKFLVPWFIIQKPDGDKIKTRLISDCRAVNQFLVTKHFKLDHWGNIFPLLRKGQWAAKIDLRNAYFHLALSEDFRPYIRMNVGPRTFQFNAACFGLSTLPQLWMSIMKVFLKKWRSQGITVFIYLDDILLLGGSPSQVQNHLAILLEDLEQSGMLVNREKSILQPTQSLDHLGFHLDFSKGILSVPPQKVKAVRKELGKLVTHTGLSPRKMASILGTVRSFLQAMPFLRAFTDSMVQFVSRHRQHGWNATLPIPPALQDQVRSVKGLLANWHGTPMPGRVCTRHLQSDSSQTGWGGLDLLSGRFVQEYWREDQHLHINVKELRAAQDTVRSLARKGDKVSLEVDNTVAFSYLTKQGGRNLRFNALMRPFLQWCREKDIHLQVTLVPSACMQADALSRWEKDKGDYTLDHALFLHLENILKFRSHIDMFASPGNCKKARFVSRWPHFQADRIDALRCRLEDLSKCYANPPWNIILAWLNRLWQNPHITCMCIVPHWVSAPWWPLLVRMQVPHTKAILIPHSTACSAIAWGLACRRLGGPSFVYYYPEHVGGKTSRA